MSELDETLLPGNREKFLVLDLTENNFNGLNDLKFLFDFVNLKTLIIDKNQIQSNIRLPYMHNLSTLWLNHNKIENLAIFVQNISMSCPSLIYLSMINNKASPSYFNGGTLAEYNDYRFFTISKLPKLSMLDDKKITAEERAQSKAIYGTGRLARFNDFSRKSVQIKKKNLDKKFVSSGIYKGEKRIKRANSVKVNYKGTYSGEEQIELVQKSDLNTKSVIPNKLEIFSSMEGEELAKRTSGNLALDATLFDLPDLEENLHLINETEYSYLNQSASEDEDEKELENLPNIDKNFEQEKYDLARGISLSLPTCPNQPSPPSPPLSILIDLDDLPELDNNRNDSP